MLRWRAPPGAATFQLPAGGGAYVRVDSGVQEGDLVRVQGVPVLPAHCQQWQELARGLCACGSGAQEGVLAGSRA